MGGAEFNARHKVSAHTCFSPLSICPHICASLLIVKPDYRFTKNIFILPFVNDVREAALPVIRSPARRAGTILKKGVIPGRWGAQDRNIEQQSMNLASRQARLFTASNLCKAGFVITHYFPYCGAGVSNYG